MHKCVCKLQSIHIHPLSPASANESGTECKKWEFNEKKMVRMHEISRFNKESGPAEHITVESRLPRSNNPRGNPSFSGFKRHPRTSPTLPTSEYFLSRAQRRNPCEVCDSQLSCVIQSCSVQSWRQQQRFMDWI